MGYPSTIYKEYMSFYDSIHYNTNLSAISKEWTSKTSAFGYNCSVLADLLCPKKALLDTELDIAIENLRFISYPIDVSE